MSTPELWDEPLTAEMLSAPDRPLSNEEIETLWRLFRAIGVHWEMTKFEVELLRSRWLDMLEARSAGAPDYRGEYENAASVYASLVEKVGEPVAIVKVYQETLVTDASQATTRLRHLKFYVANDFLRCFIATGGFRGFVEEARNYTGFMGGSRFRDWPPVRVGRRR